MPQHEFTMDLTPVGNSSCVMLDGQDISALLRAVEVRSSMDEATTVHLFPGRGAAFVTLTALLPEAQIVIHEPPKEEP